MINEHGIWLDKNETDTHLFDVSLCKCIAGYFKRGRTIIDVGCGNGDYTKKLREAGFDCVGYDGSPLTPEISGGLCKVADFSQPVGLGTYDVVLCLEVGEHIPVEYEQVFIDNICKLSTLYILLSWAIEGQPGYGHVNCRNNDYVISEMLKRGFHHWSSVSKDFREVSTLPWFRNTLLMFTKKY
jgi:2-polyprenyl-3-methyl-5-hydroxy-6-metoxy-1,4-benzoquinol methylase